MCHLKRRPTTVQKWNQKQAHPCIIDCSCRPRDTRVRIPFVARPLRKICAGVNTLCLRSELVFIAEHHCRWQSSVAIRETFNNAYPDKKMPSKTTGHRLVSTFRNKGNVYLWQVLIEGQKGWNYCHSDFRQLISCSSGIRLREFDIAIGFVVLWWRGSFVVIRIAF
jgi:hypothetical protein